MIEDKTGLTNEQVDKELKNLNGWRREERILKKDFTFNNFKEINKFLPYLATTIVKQNHHPDFSLITKEKRISIVITTHSVGGLTQADINFARTLNTWKDK